MSRVSIVGFGRFGPILAKMLMPRHEVVVYDETDVSSAVEAVGILQVAWEEVCLSETVILSVPIRRFKDAVVKLLPNLREGMTVIDVCSVKVYPVTVMQAHLPAGVHAIATHPLFGPDSAANGFEGLRMAMHPVSERDENYNNWRREFENMGLKIIEITPEEHDRQAARSQGITHFVGRVLDSMNLSEEDVTTRGFRDLRRVVEQTCQDSIELFEDLENYNPSTAAVIEDLLRSVQQVKQSINRS